MGSEILLYHGGGVDSTPPLPGNPLGTTFDQFFYTHPKVYIQRGLKKNFGSLPSKLKILWIFEKKFDHREKFSSRLQKLITRSILNLLSSSFLQTSSFSNQLRTFDLQMDFD